MIETMVMHKGLQPRLQTGATTRKEPPDLAPSRNRSAPAVLMETSVCPLRRTGDAVTEARKVRKMAQAWDAATHSGRCR